MKCRLKNSVDYIQIEPWMINLFEQAGWHGEPGDYFVSSPIRGRADSNSYILMTKEDFEKQFSIVDEENDPFLEDIKIDSSFNDDDPFHKEVKRDKIVRTPENVISALKNYNHMIPSVCHGCDSIAFCTNQGECRYTGSPLTNPEADLRKGL